MAKKKIKNFQFYSELLKHNISEIALPMIRRKPLVDVVSQLAKELANELGRSNRTEVT